MANDPIIFGPWTGGTLSSRAIVKIAVTSNAGMPQLVFSSEKNSSGNLVNPKTVPPVSMKVSPEMTILTFVLEGNVLKPNTSYFYVPKIGNQEIKNKQGRFKTFPLEGLRHRSDSPAPAMPIAAPTMKYSLIFLMKTPFSFVTWEIFIMKIPIRRT
jgi:hypothetical protein